MIQKSSGNMIVEITTEGNSPKIFDLLTGTTGGIVVQVVYGHSSVII